MSDQPPPDVDAVTGCADDQGNYAMSELKPHLTAVDEVISAVKRKSEGRTRYEGQSYWDELMVAEIDRLRGEIASERRKGGEMPNSDRFETTAWDGLLSYEADLLRLAQIVANHCAGSYAAPEAWQFVDDLKKRGDRRKEESGRG